MASLCKGMFTLRILAAEWTWILCTFHIRIRRGIACFQQKFRGTVLTRHNDRAAVSKELTCSFLTRFTRGNHFKNDYGSHGTD